jgi:hypothetical protein
VGVVASRVCTSPQRVLVVGAGAAVVVEFDGGGGADIALVVSNAISYFRGVVDVGEVGEVVGKADEGQHPCLCLVMVVVQGKEAAGPAVSLCLCHH